MTLGYTMAALLNLLLLCVLFIYTEGAASSRVYVPAATSYFVEPLRNVLSRLRRQEPTDNVVNKPDITDLHIDADVVSRFATVRVSSKVVNSESEDLEASFTVQMPESAFIANFTMLINETFYVGQVMEKRKAQEKYDKAREQGQSAGQVKHQARNIARGMDIFAVNVNVAADSDVEFVLTYQELLERRLGHYEQRISVQPLQLVNNLTLNLRYSEPQMFESFSYRLPNSSIDRDSSHDSTVLVASSDTRHITYTPSVARQREINAVTGIDGEFRVTYDVTHGYDGGNIVSAVNNNFFVHYFAPEGPELQLLPKNVMFVIDISGSMSGTKIAQTRDAMKGILPQLGSSDYFNIMVFSGATRTWLQSSVIASPVNIQAAKVFVDANVHAGGGTNINDALKESVDDVAKDVRSREASAMIVFLTDGQPSVGVTNVYQIRRNIMALNERRVSIFSLGFGYGVDFDFLQAVSYDNGGFARRIYEDADAASQLTNFFKEVNTPLLLDIEFEYGPNQIDPNAITLVSFSEYFSGAEIVVAGIRLVDTADITAKVRGNTITSTVELDVKPKGKTELAATTHDNFIEKLWAYLTIKDLLRQKTIAFSLEEAKSIEAKALNMSLKYNFVTPLTSLVIVQEQTQQGTQNDILASRASDASFLGTSGITVTLLVIISLLGNK